MIGATNRPDLVDPSMLQPGRFDVMIYLGVSEGKEERVKILKAQTRKMRLRCSLEEVEDCMPQGLTGADIYSFVSRAYKRALLEKKEELRNEVLRVKGRLDRRAVKDVMAEHAGGLDLEPVLDLGHFKEEDTSGKNSDF